VIQVPKSFPKEVVVEIFKLSSDKANVCSLEMVGDDSETSKFQMEILFRYWKLFVIFLNVFCKIIENTINICDVWITLQYLAYLEKSHLICNL